jgi:hypothetical protein
VERACPEPKPVFIALLIAGALAGQIIDIFLWRVLVHLQGVQAVAGRGTEIWIAGGTLGLAACFGACCGVGTAMARRRDLKLLLSIAFFAAAHRSCVWVWLVLAYPNYGVPWWEPRWLGASAALALIPVSAWHVLTRPALRALPALLLLLLGGIVSGYLMAAVTEIVLPTGAPWQFSNRWFDMALSWGLMFSGMFLGLRLACALDKRQRGTAG